MSKHVVGIIKYTEKEKSLKEAVEISNAFQHLSANAKVVIKPNIVFWSTTEFPKWGVITTSRIIEDIVILLKDYGVSDITIAEGTMRFNPKDKNIGDLAYDGLGYNKLKKRYGVKSVDIFNRPFEKINFGGGVELSVNSDIVHSDFVVNAPVLKTHAQTKVSLGMKNLKGMLNINSRKTCHSPDTDQDLNYMISRLPKMLPPSATIIDGIYTLERGPSIDGKPRKSDILVASSDLLSADMIGAKILGYNTEDVAYLAHAAEGLKRPFDYSDIEIKGEKIEDVEALHEYTFPYNEDGSLPEKMAKMGIEGISYYKYDLTMCTYCAGITGAMLMAIAMTWKGKPFDNVEVLHGKIMQPRPGKNKTILLGKCMVNLHKDNPEIKEMIPIKGCPPEPKQAAEALSKIGINVDPSLFENIDKGGAYFMSRYKGKAEFDESFYTID